MHKIDINLVSKKEDSALITAALAFFAVAIALASSFYNMNAYFKNASYIKHMSERVAALEGRLPQGDSSRAGNVDMKAMRRDIDFINAYVEKKVFSWTGLLTELEEILPARVYLLQVSPDFEKSNVNISGMASSMDDVLMTVKNMESGGFENAFLTRHSRDREKLIIFNISAQYRAELKWLD